MDAQGWQEEQLEMLGTTIEEASTALEASNLHPLMMTRDDSETEESSSEVEESEESPSPIRDKGAERRIVNSAWDHPLSRKEKMARLLKLFSCEEEQRRNEVADLKFEIQRLRQKNAQLRRRSFEGRQPRVNRRLSGSLLSIEDSLQLSPIVKADMDATPASTRAEAPSPEILGPDLPQNRVGREVLNLLTTPSRQARLPTASAAVARSQIEEVRRSSKKKTNQEQRQDEKEGKQEPQEEKNEHQEKQAENQQELKEIQSESESESESHRSAALTEAASSEAKGGEASSTFKATKLGAAGGGAAGGAGGGIIGGISGGAIGAAVGVIPALFTFGLSIPVGAVIGSGAGLLSGAVVGGTAGAVGGGAAGYGIDAARREKHENPK
eukprot:TRINITY_DN16681_c0_g1_i2.p1 TRINITY_DN16681_c0_g1~~TRINITY_DN16681_c0_g1_i2.p1  ORF type:complete len:383 (-),score=107.81 TRINITY_DN16681_c0_g1_i2:269-1417(-)